MMLAMSEITSLPYRMHFTALRTFDVHAGIGGAIAIFWEPAQRRLGKQRPRQEQRICPAAAAPRPDANRAAATEAGHPVESDASDG